MTDECASNVDSVQPGHSPSIIRVFAALSGQLHVQCKLSSCGERRL